MYSKVRLINKLDNAIKNYSKAINEINEFSKSSYCRSLNINIFLCQHIKWGETAMEILWEVVEKLKNNNLKKAEVENLKSLIKNCRKEHNDIEDTYKRVHCKNTSDYYEFQQTLMKLRELCDEVEYYDEFIVMLENYIEEEKIIMNNSNNFYGKALGIQIQQGVKDSSQIQIIDNDFDYKQVESVIKAIRQYDGHIDSDYKDVAIEVREKLQQIEILVSQEREPQQIRNLLGDLKNLSIGITGSLIASGIVSMITPLL